MNTPPTKAGLSPTGLVGVGALLLAAGGLKTLTGGELGPFGVLSVGIGAVLLVAGFVLKAMQR